MNGRVPLHEALTRLAAILAVAAAILVAVRLIVFPPTIRVIAHPVPAGAKL
jgi:hypothetical protein